ncbi:hypothetical protein [Ancylothrix sp. D3o]|nr:hypothetical protein [Ancylothrix sp. D3o]
MSEFHRPLNIPNLLEIHWPLDIPHRWQMNRLCYIQQEPVWLKV